MKHLSPIIVILCILCNSCHEWAYEAAFSVANNSSERLVAYAGFYHIAYPDTTLPLRAHWSEPINPKDTVRIIFAGGIVSGPDYVEISNRLDKDTMSVFLVSLDSVSKYGWEEIIKNNIIARRYDMSPDDFRAIKNTISYPPTPEMSHIKMWPPYGE